MLSSAENLAAQLSEAISYGDKCEAKRCAEKLAALSIPVSVKVDQENYPQDTIRYEFNKHFAAFQVFSPKFSHLPFTNSLLVLLTHRLRVGVEDAMSDSYIPITIIVTVSMTISELKIKVNCAFSFSFNRDHDQRSLLWQNSTGWDTALYTFCMEF